MAKERGKAQADSLRKTRRDTVAYRLTSEDKIEQVLSRQLKPGEAIRDFRKFTDEPLTLRGV
jgi:potassium-transporting ATPase ATP-binding subunit